MTRTRTDTPRLADPAGTWLAGLSRGALIDCVIECARLQPDRDEGLSCDDPVTVEEIERMLAQVVRARGETITVAGGVDQTESADTHEVRAAVPASPSWVPSPANRAGTRQKGPAGS